MTTAAESVMIGCGNTGYVRVGGRTSVKRWGSTEHIILRGEHNGLEGEFLLPQEDFLPLIAMLRSILEIENVESTKVTLEGVRNPEPLKKSVKVSKSKAV